MYGRNQRDYWFTQEACLTASSYYQQGLHPTYQEILAKLKENYSREADDYMRRFAAATLSHLQMLYKSENSPKVIF